MRTHATDPPCLAGDAQRPFLSQHGTLRVTRYTSSFILIGQFDQGIQRGLGLAGVDLGAGARHLHDAKGRELQSILCEAADERLFTYMLTPHFNKAHADHMHLEVKPGVKWFLVN